MRTATIRQRDRERLTGWDFRLCDDGGYIYESWYPCHEPRMDDYYVRLCVPADGLPYVVAGRYVENSIAHLSQAEQERSITHALITHGRPGAIHEAVRIALQVRKNWA